MISPGFEGKDSTKTKQLLRQNHLIAIQFLFKKLVAHQGSRSIDRGAKWEELSTSTQNPTRHRASLTPMAYINKVD